ncbi:hydroxymethylglutaryl-CoA lyase [Kineococcus sp. DHX-1]|uniref:hydroxymethylglutaryl-CoA lyase n=1 Tax=Kineococcus sp. DHX-1 TaxID=3349638 RepID=UPI0036D23442
MSTDPGSWGVELRDVTLRDGLQLVGRAPSTERKVEIVRELLALGVPSLEIGSMARPDLVPTLADTLDVVDALTPEELERCWVWVATPGHVRRAAERGATNFQYCLSVSDAHNRANLGRSTEASLDTVPDGVSAAGGGRVQLTLATSFTCPFDGPVDPDEVVRIAADPRTAGTVDVVVCDTLGQATPGEVGSLVARVRAETPPRRTGFHGHDTWGQGVANALAAVQAGAAFVDGTLGGLGGCPFAPGASGNTATEDLLFGLRPSWLTPSAFADVVRLAEQVVADLGERSSSKAAQGARSRAEAFDWVVR